MYFIYNNQYSFCNNKNYKNKTPIINENERCLIVKNIKSVDECFIVDDLDKVKLAEKFGFDAIFIGCDWKGNER